ncbi:MAG TPA: sialidase family protein, partial [Cyclobacteriaceae bacterium]|nr:sialidase family protein [Cyclobacteriaceae bacterium]
MRRILLTLVCLLGFAILAEAQWTATNGPFGGYITSIRRSTTGTLYAVINSQLYQSTNNGDNWTITSSSLYLQDLLIDSDGKMYAVYYSTYYMSADNGATWTTVSTNAFQGAQRIDKFGPAGVFATWGTNGLYVSTNKGTTWTQLSSLPFSANLESAFAANASGDIYYAASNGTIYKHLYGTGSNWSSANLVATGFPAGEFIYSMAVDAAGRIYVTSNLDIRISANGGTSFTSIKTGLAPTNSFYGVIAVAPDGTTVWLFNNSDSKIYKSLNQGTTWTNTSASPTVTYGSQVRAVVFASASTFFVGSTSDGVFRTSDTGATWAFKSTGLTFGNVNELEVANTTNKIIAVKGGSGYWSSTDAGATWTINPISDYVNHIIKLANGNILMYGSRVFRSTDNGATFSPSALYYYHYKIVEAANGDLYGFSYGKLAKSTDSGVTWTDITLTGYSATMQGSYAAIDGTTNIMVHG